MAPEKMEDIIRKFTVFKVENGDIFKKNFQNKDLKGNV